jgi:formylglycine-generating enzyme required for sulfatase activity
VGSYLQGASPYGALDMSGNVAEWVFDWYSEGYYSISDFDNPLGPVDGEEKVYRGGSFADVGTELTTTGRGFAEPAARLQTVGFRCAWTPTGDPTMGE